jgi:oligogalacturonide transporter
MTLMRKLVQGLFALPAIGFMLQGIGFATGVTQAPETLARFFAFFIGVPSGLLVLGIFTATRFRITPKNHAVVRLELERLRAGGSPESVDTVTRQLCESLSGQPWERCWGRHS